MHTTCKGCATIHDASGLVCTPLKKVISNAACLIATKTASTPITVPAGYYALANMELVNHDSRPLADRFLPGLNLQNNLPAGPIIEHMKS